MQNTEQHIYAAIDLKSFYASVECQERGLNPLTTNLIVADNSRTEKTVCLAVTPTLKQYGIAGRARLFEVIKKVKEIIAQGKIGAIKHIESSFYNRFEKNLKNRFWNPDLAGGGLLDLGIYCIYYALCINNFEKIEEHSSSVRLENGVDAWNSANFKFKNGVTTHFQTAMDISSTTNSHDAVIYGSKGFITSTNFLRQEKAEVYLYKNDKGGEFELSEEIKAPFDINGFEYQLIHATECINKGIIESDIHSFQRSIELCEIMDMLRKDWGMKYPFEK